MEIKLTSQSTNLEWNRFFWILAYNRFHPVWRELGFPSFVVENPERIREICHRFLNGQEAYPVQNGLLTSQTAVDSYLEARRMVDLGRLYISFGEIQIEYGTSGAVWLHNFGERHFASRIAGRWLYWEMLFNRISAGELPAATAIGTKAASALVRSIDFRRRQAKTRIERTNTIIRKLVEAVESDCSDELRKFLMRSHFDDQDAFDLRTGIENYFAFDLLFEEIYASDVWSDFSASNDQAAVSVLFDWTVQEITKQIEQHPNLYELKNQLLRFSSTEYRS